MHEAKDPIAVVREAFGDDLPPILWPAWIETHRPGRYQGGYDPQLRLAEPVAPDVDGAKYVVREGAPVTLARAVDAFLALDDCDDAITVAGSGRPILVWKVPLGMRERAPKCYWPGCSSREADALAALVPRPAREMVVIRIPVKQATARRARRCAEFERGQFGDGKRNQYLASYCLAAVMSRMEETEAVMKLGEGALRGAAEDEHRDTARK